MLSDKADFSEVGAAAMFELGGHYYYGNYGFLKDVGKTQRFGLICRIPSTIKRRATVWLCATGRLIQKTSMHVSTSKKLPFLGNAKARFLLGHGTPDFKVGMKHLEIAARQGHTRAMTCLREAYRHGKLEKNLFLDVARAHHDMVKATESYDRTWGNKMQAESDAHAKSKSKKRVKSKSKKR